MFSQCGVADLVQERSRDDSTDIIARLALGLVELIRSGILLLGECPIQEGIQKGPTTGPHPRLLRLEAASTVSASAAEAVSFDHRPRLVDGQVTAPHFCAVQCIDRFVRIRLVRHLNEAKTFRPARVPIRDDADRLHGTKTRERLRDIALCRLK